MKLLRGWTMKKVGGLGPVRFAATRGQRLAASVLQEIDHDLRREHYYAQAFALAAHHGHEGIVAMIIGRVYNPVNVRRFACSGWGSLPHVDVKR